MAQQSNGLRRIIPISWKTVGMGAAHQDFTPTAWNNPAPEVSNGFSSGINLGTFYRKLAMEHPDPNVRANAEELLATVGRGMGCCQDKGMGDWVSQGNGTAVNTTNGVVGNYTGSFQQGYPVPNELVTVGGAGPSYSAPAPTSAGASTTFAQDAADFGKAFGSIFTPVAGAGFSIYNTLTGRTPQPQAQPSTTPSWVAPVAVIGIAGAIGLAVVMSKGSGSAPAKKQNAPKRRSRLVVY